MKINVIEMMHSLSHHKYEELYILASKEGVKVPTPSCSKIELITLIITNRAEKGDSVLESNRRKYCLRCEDTDPYFLKLTLDQYNLLDWCIRNEIWLPHAEVDELSDVEWETP